MCDQLDVFLQHQTQCFVSKLFVKLETKSYLQSNTEPLGVATQAEAPNVPTAAIAAIIPAAEKVNKLTTKAIVKTKRDSRTSSTKNKPVDMTKKRSKSPRYVI